MSGIDRHELIATATFGVESIVAEELRELGCNDLIVENGRVCFSGGQKEIARANLWLRSADRVLIQIARFPATDFGALFDHTVAVPWETFIPATGKMHVIGKSHKSKLFSVPDCQSIVKKAIVEAMKRRHRVAHFEETGPLYRVEVSLLSDMVTLTLDTTGPGLHKRGYRAEGGEAPLRESLAAALVKLSKWLPGRELADPFCGSGTIPIEAALMGCNIAPGLGRTFVCEEWPDMKESVWHQVREEARAVINRSAGFRILASDIDARMVKIATLNAQRAGVAKFISFQKQGIDQFSSSKRYGCFVCNPPYGERTGETVEVEAAYKTMGEVYRRLDSWSLFALTAHPHFERLFRQRAQKKRKLFNGNILCHFYQYFGPLPPKRRGFLGKGS
jgi:putative N6-adenine-specific DNA methylase